MRRLRAWRRPGRATCAAAAGALLALAFAGCGGMPRPEPPAAPASAPIVVYVLADFSPSEELAFARLSELFAREEAGRVQVELRGPSDYTALGLPSEAVAGPTRGAASEGLPGAPSEAPQIAIVGEAGLAPLLSEHRVAPLADPASSEIARDLLPPAGAAVGAGEGPSAGLFALPLDLDVDVLYVRRGLLYQPPASWDDVAGVARRSTSGGREAGPIAVGEADSGPLVALAALALAGGGQAGPPPAAPSESPPILAAPTAADLAGPPGQAAVGALRASLASGDVRFVRDPEQAFASGQVGLALAPASRLGDLEAALGGHAAFLVSRLPGLPVSARFAVPLPYGPAAARRAAAEFLAFLASPASQAFWAIQTGRLPAVLGAYETDAWQGYLRHHPEVAVMADAARRAPAWGPELLPSAPAAADALLRGLVAEAAARPPRVGR